MKRILHTMGIKESATLGFSFGPIPKQKPKMADFFRGDTVTKGQLISKANYGVLDSSKKLRLGQFSVHEIAPAFLFWKNPGQHIFFSRFSDL